MSFALAATGKARWSDMVDWHAVNELLFRLDYRRRLVKIAGSRKDWFRKFRENWLNVRLFDSFYRVMLHRQQECFKPIYATERFSCLGQMSSPFWSARWLLDDYESWGYF